MQAHDLKEYMAKDYKRLTDVLERVKCHGIKEYTNEFRCGLPEKTNTTMVSIKKDNLSMAIFYGDKERVTGDIFTLIMEIKGWKFSDTIRWIHDILNLKYTWYGQEVKKEKKSSVLDMYKSIRKKTYNKYEDITTFPEYILEGFDKLHHISLLKDNIIPSTLDEFDIRFSTQYKRIIIPHRKWDTDEIVGIFGRTVVEDYEEKNIPKYFGIIPYPKSTNLFGLNVNYKHIQEKGYVIVVEGEKSVMQAHSFGEKTCVALGSHDISREQRRILLGLNVDIIMAFDNDIPLAHVHRMCRPFNHIRNVYYLKDDIGMLGDKDSPTDKGRVVFDILFGDKKEYNDYTERGVK